MAKKRSWSHSGAVRKRSRKIARIVRKQVPLPKAPKGYFVIEGARDTYGPTHRTGGYPKGNEFQDWHGNKIGRIVRKSCSRVKPWQRGAWISNERCSYVVEIDGRLYAGRGRGDGVAVNLRQMKRRR